MFSGNRVEVLNQQPDRLAAQLGKNMPFVREMLVDYGVRIADLFSDRTKRHAFVTAIGKHFAGSRKDFAPQPLLALYPATWGCGCHFNSLVRFDAFCDQMLLCNHWYRNH